MNLYGVWATSWKLDYVSRFFLYVKNELNNIRINLKTYTHVYVYMSVKEKKMYVTLYVK